VIESETLYKSPSEMTEEQNARVDAACTRGNLLSTAMILNRHEPQEVVDALMSFMGEETDFDEAIHGLAQALFTTISMLHMVGHLAPPGIMEAIDDAVDHTNFEQTMKDSDAVQRLLADIMGAPEEGPGED
jgi:hypothetical protein